MKGDALAIAGRALAAQYSFTKNLMGCFAKSHRTRAQKALRRVAENLRFWVPLQQLLAKSGGRSPVPQYRSSHLFQIVTWAYRLHDQVSLAPNS